MRFTKNKIKQPDNFDVVARDLSWICPLPHKAGLEAIPHALLDYMHSRPRHRACPHRFRLRPVFVWHRCGL